MLEKGRISPYQLFCLVFGFMFGNSVLLQSLTSAGRDSWLSTILAMLAGAGMALVLTGLAVKFPQKTLIEYAQELFGKTLGKIIGILYLWYFLHVAALVMRDFGEFMTTEIMPETPLWFFQVTLAMLVVLFISNGIEVMGRVSEVVFPVSTVFSLLIGLLLSLTGVLDLRNLFPLLEHGAVNVVKGAVPPFAFPYGEIVIFSMIFPYVNNVAKTAKAALPGIFAPGFLLLNVLVQDIALFGEYMANLTFPRFAAIMVISLADFIERIDAIVVAIWNMGALVKVGVCLYAFVLGLAQILGLKDYKSLSVPAAMLAVVLAVLVYENTFQLLNFAVNVYPIYALPFEVILPLLMLILASLKKRGKRRSINFSD